MRIFLDANVLFSAARSEGAVRRLLDLLIEAGHECWADGFVAEEARRNLAAKFPDGLSVLETLLLRLVTGDRAHFGRLYGKAIHGVPIHTPRSIAETLLPDALPAPKMLRQPRRRY